MAEGLSLTAAPEGDGRVYLVDKPAGVTSFAMVRRVRRLLGIKKVGHAGTLDPFATGLLIICAGRSATRHIDRFMAGRKTYQATLQLGIETDTQDPEGLVLRSAPVPELDREGIERCLLAHVGPQLQAPPPFSAAKHRGKPLYAYARQGVTIVKEPRAIEIHALSCAGYDSAACRLHLAVTCSRGTYIRVLAADIGRDLGCGAHLVELRRVASGAFSVTASLPGSELFEENAVPRLLEHSLGLEEALRAVDETTLCPGAV